MSTATETDEAKPVSTQLRLPTELVRKVRFVAIALGLSTAEYAEATLDAALGRDLPKAIAAMRELSSK